MAVGEGLKSVEGMDGGLATLLLPEPSKHLVLNGGDRAVEEFIRHS
jgi:hypothetical protein